MSETRTVSFVDITLRDGEQAANVAFSPAEKVELAWRILDVGVPELQVGFAGEDDDIVRALKNDGFFGARISLLVAAFSDSVNEQVKAAADAGVDVIQVVARAGARQLAAMGKTADDSLRQAEAALACIIDAGVKPALIPSFMTSAEASVVERFAELAAAHEVASLTVADSNGIGTPAKLASLVEQARAVVDVTPVGVHCHDDFGLAVANTLAGIEAGAAFAEATINGYGERSGNCDLGSAALASERLLGRVSGLRLERLTALARRASEITGVPIPPDQPLVGENAFVQKIDMHVALTQTDPTLFEPYPPEVVGAQRALRLGVGTGPMAIRAKLRELALEDKDDIAVDRLVRSVEEAACRHETVTDAVFARMVAEL